MPKKPLRNKPTGPQSVGAVLQGRRSPFILDQLKSRASAAAGWREFVINQLPAELSSHVTGANLREHRLVILADSAAWAARIRFEAQRVAEAARASHPEIVGVEVRIRPRG